MTARIGVIGTGWWATRAHLPAIAAHPDAELVAIADPNEANRSRAAEVFAPPASYGDYRDMLQAEQLDGIARGGAAHPALRYRPRCAAPGRARAAREADGAEQRSRSRATARGRRARARDHRGLPVVHYNEQVNRAREWIASGAIGNLLYVHSLFASIVWELYRGEPELVADAMGYTVNPTGRDTYSDPALSGGGQGVTQITHSGALLLHMTGLEPAEVFAHMHNHDLRVDLVDALSVRFEGGCLGTIGIHRIDRAHPGGGAGVPALRHRRAHPVRCDE